MGCVQSYFKRAHNAGLSPSSTHDSDSKTGGNGELQVGDSSSEREKKTSLVSHERLPEEPESNDTSYGVEATAVRTLAASTGTVAILGTTAQTAEKSKSQTDLTEDSTKDIDLSIQDDNKEEVKSPESNNQNKRQSKADDNSTTVSDIVIENDERATSSSLSDSNKEEINKLKERTESTIEQPIENHVKPDTTTSHENSIESHTNSLDSDNVPHEPSVKQTTTALVENIKSTDDESETSLLPNGEINNLSIDKDDVCSSEDNLDDEEERPATVVEIGKNINNKENESKSRSSISENSGSDDTKGMTDDISSEQLKTNSFSDTTLSESFNAELDSIKHSPEGKEEINIDDDDDAIIIESAETVPEKENETKDGKKPLELSVVMPKFDSEAKSSDDEEQKTETKEDEIKKETIKEISEIPSKSENKEVKTENEVVKSPPLNTLENILSEEECKQVLKSIEIPESNKKLSELPLSDQKDEKPKTPKPDVIEEKIEPTIIKKDQAKPNIEKTEVKEEIIIPETVKRVESILPPGKNEEKLDNKTEADESKLADAATTIQATFRGYQTRQNIQKKDPEKEDILVQIEKEIEVKDTEDKDKLDSAATTIQANFRGFQTRQNLQKEEDKEDKTQVDSVDTDNNEKEKLEQAATTIQASFRGYQTRQNIQKPEENQDEKPKDTNKNVEENNVEVTEKPIELNKNVEETINLNDEKEALESAATTIQATFRGYQARQNIEKDKAMSKNSEESLAEEITIDPVTSVSIKDKTEKLTDEISKDASIEKEIASTKSEIKDLETEANDKLSSAATTIQSNFRGFKTRKNLGKKSVTICEDNLEDDDVEDEERIKAATKIQANFRGFQTRKKLDGKHTDEDDEEIILHEPPSLTPELIESVKEEVDEICKQAVETTENMIKNGTDILFRAQLGSAVSNKNYEESESEIADSENESITTTANRTVQSIVEEAEHVAEERLNSAATRIQASFRGFQVRKNVDKPEETDGIPDFPPSTDEDYLFGTPVLDDDLPLPDFEALESSYSEEVATEPIDVLPPPLENLAIPESEEVSEASTEINDDDLRYLQRRQECDELKKTPELETSSEGESSLSSAATKIQAGVRGYLTRKHIQTGQGGTASTSGPSIASSDQSLGDLVLSKDEDGPVKSMISTEEETEICRHLSTPEKNEPRIISPIDSKKLNKKRMSLDSRLVVHPPSKNARPMRAMSVSSPRDDVTNEEVWQTLQDELTNAATRIQSNYRGYRARKQLTRGDAVQMATTSSSATGTPTPTNTSFDGVNNRTNGNVDRTSGEYHDIIALTPPTSLTTLGEKKEGEIGELKEKDGVSEKKQSVEGVKPTGELTAPASEEESKMVKRRHADDKKEEEDDEEKAAAKIQAGFRGYKVRKEMKPEDDKSSNKSNTTQSADNSKNKSTDSARNSRDAENEAAAKIQAGFRGMKTRQELKSKQNSSK